MGHIYNFPCNLKEYTKCIVKYNSFIDDLKEAKENDNEKYNELTTDLLPKNLIKINKRIVVFSLGIYDHPDYLLSAIFANKSGVESATLEDFEQPKHRTF